ncbi:MULTISPECIES: lipoprotein-releasing ABC transporter permease subunit [unclassified Paracoccus (in: a-proteobacteria)]|uniref:lipoprotein-releasing ABC transporter permease subunit n=1 Tax=unclassified Paracoccus (in: a-proteobacteria) TaxID=2688777 RepID=UPI001603D346|nr:MULTISPECIES: lipoprotein-releasing ABC transporter permease subunit [unclassified Paracoccus (in: a-proteobacteria)]MBB1490938.1 lipoprotein-releasing ABC transporter permease subunit [Paracoccus sp. MC1854]MBB1497718.1 lipoprotein-releasing ABC transporter permease subunit [Paracoccus sp. MC1862]QQO45210.1 lipoprotein-releasing ABC transporter permease subunit [Paracoccus sp. MC1862]
MANPAPFARYEFMIAWRYLRARRAEGGVSVMTWISLIGIALGVMALIATLAVRSGFRAEFVDTILGANAHSTVYLPPSSIVNELTDEVYTVAGTISDYPAAVTRIEALPGVERADPVVRGQVMASVADRSNVAEVYGLSAEDLAAIPRVANPETAEGNLSDFDEGVAIGIGMARELGVNVGDLVQLISPHGAQTAFGTTPRIATYPVVYVFSAGRYDIDRTRIYMPLAEAQSFFNREGVVDEIQVFVSDPEGVDALTMPLMQALPGGIVWTWRDASGSFLSALDIEDDVMFVILSVLVLIASMNITSGLIMLVKNKGRDIGILRTMGLTEGAILRVFFLCGAFTGIIGTIAGVILGVLLALNVDSIMAGINWFSGGGAWDASVRGIYRLPAELRGIDIAKAVGLSLTLSFIVTIFPARRAARMNPVEALRYE